MGRIRVLDPRELTRSRRASCGATRLRAKELVETPWTQARKTLQIRVRGAGWKRSVLDDGEGMDEETSASRSGAHATSKISHLDQLASSPPWGSGESAPSIASVSRMILESSPDGSGKGTRVRIEGGRASPPEIVGHPRGPRDGSVPLLHAPARRQVPAGASTETGHLVEVVSRTALAHFQRRWDLEVDGKTRTGSVARRRSARAGSKDFGASLSGQLVPFAKTPDYRASGFASRPELTRPTTRDQWLFVNGRPVKDRALLHAHRGGLPYSAAGGRFPLVLLFLEVPPSAPTSTSTRPRRR